MEQVTQPSTVKAFPDASPWFLRKDEEGISPRPFRCLKITVI